MRVTMLVHLPSLTLQGAISMDIYTTDKIATIYRATNTINGKVYIGFDSAWPMRRNCHKSHHQGVDDTTKFYRAIRKYGWKSFVWDVIYQSKEIEHTLKVMEPHFISEHDSKNNGYNSTEGGDGIVGLKHSKVTKRKLAEHFGKPCRGPDGTVYFSANEAAVQTGLTKWKVLNWSRRNIYGWSYDLNSVSLYKEPDTLIKYLLIDPNGNEHIVVKLSKFCADMNLPKHARSNLVHVAKGRDKQYRGWKCSYYQDSSFPESDSKS